MTPISDAVLDHLREVADWPDLEGSRYEVLERIGRGGMGTVYRARDRELGRLVALKVVDVTLPDGQVDDLAREARVLAGLEHPGIVPVHDLGRLPDGRPYYVMKLVWGRRLDEHARDLPSLPSRLRLFEKLCEAVAFAHDRGVIHRDLKPENVMVGSFGEVLVMDWGTAKVLAAPGEAAPLFPDGPPARAGQTAYGTVLGTPGYMAPEQERGEVDRIDERSDVHALGAILRFLLSVPEGTGAERGPFALRPLHAIAAKAAAAEAARRYAKVPDLAQDVADFLSGLPVTAYREGPLERLWRLARKHRTPLLLVLAYLVMRALLLFGFRV